VEKCEHYWLIPKTADRTCQGVCRKCDARREFLNQMPDNHNWLNHARKTIRVAPGGHYIAEVLAEGAGLRDWRLLKPELRRDIPHET